MCGVSVVCVAVEARLGVSSTGLGLSPGLWSALSTFGRAKPFPLPEGTVWMFPHTRLPSPLGTDLCPKLLNSVLGQ